MAFWDSLIGVFSERSLASKQARHARRRARKPRRLRPRFALAYEQLEPRQLLAYVPELVADMNPAPQDTFLSTPMGSWNGKVYFGVTNTNEFWATDGTPEGSIRLATLQLPQPPFEGWPAPTFSGDRLYFAGRAADSGAELFATDGTPQGTYLVKDILPGLAGSSPTQFIDVNGTLFFTAVTVQQQRGLWKSDGTAAGTLKVFDLPTEINSLTSFNSLLFFTERSFERRLWKSDGTPAGTSVLKDIRPSTGDSAGNLTVVRDTMYFTANDGVHGVELWKSDGTADGTTLVADIVPGAASSTPFNLTSYNGLLYFAASDGTNTALWQSDGTPEGTFAVKTFNPALPNSISGYPLPLGIANGHLLFGVTQPSTGFELWTSDGTADGTVLVKDIRPGPDSSSLNFPRVVNDVLYFVATDGVSGVELWRTDATADGTFLVKDIYPGATNSSPRSLAAVDNRLFFTATDPQFGAELWLSDGTPEGTRLALEVSHGGASSSPFNITGFDGAVYMSAFEPATGTELWRSDGTPQGTGLFHDTPIQHGSPMLFTPTAARLYFIKTDQTGSHRLWATDGTVDGTDDLFPLDPSPADRFHGLTPFDDELFFHFRRSNVTHLWKTNGTSAGTVQIQPPSGPFLSASSSSTTIGNGFLYFTASTTLNNTDLWRTDGTTAGTTLVSDLPPSFLTWVNGALYFSATATGTGDELYTSDGTDAGTHIVRDLVPGAGGSNPYSFLALGDSVVFIASTPEHGRGWWRTDGTEQGTSFFARISPASPSFSRPPAPAIVHNGYLYYESDDPLVGKSLWQTDGTPEGTRLLRDFWPESLTGSVGEFDVFNDQVYFRASDPTYGEELWRTDGTTEGTVLAADIYPGALASTPASFEVLGDSLYFAARDLEHGRELWRLVPRASAPIVAHAITTTGTPTASGLVVTRNPADGNEVTHVKITNIAHGALFLNDGVTPVVDGDFVSFVEAAKGFRFAPAAGYSGTATFGVQASTSDDDEGLGGDVVTAKIYVVPVFTGANDTLYLIANTNQTEVEVYDLDPFQFAVPPLISWPVVLPDQLPLNTLGGDDQIFVQLPAGMNGPSAGIRFDTGSGTNILTVRGGNVLIDSTSTGGSLITIVTAGAHMTTSRLDQFRLALQGTGTKVTLLPDGGVSVLDDLELSLGTTLDVTNSSLILHSTEATKEGRYIDLRAKIQSAQNGVDPNFVTNWNGTGLTSSSARAANVAAGFDLVNLGLIRNSDLDITTGVPGSAFTIFAGVPVGPHDLLLKYTYTGDGNLDGAVTFDDYAAMDAAFFGLVPTLGWATGDINFDNLINFDDYAVVDQAFFQQSAPLAGGGLGATAGGSGLAVASLSGSAVGSDDPGEPEALAPGVISPLYSLPSPLSRSARRPPSRDLWETALLDVLR